jgi:hypothetical protein
MNPVVAIASWGSWYWRQKHDSLAFLYRAVKARRLDDEVGWRRHAAAAMASESRAHALVAALEAFCHAHSIDPVQALAAASVDRISVAPGFDTQPDHVYQRAIETALSALAAPKFPRTEPKTNTKGNEHDPQHHRQ